MVLGLGPALQNAELFPAIECSSRNQLEQMCLTHVMGTGARHKNSAWRKLSQRSQIDFFVTAGRSFEGSACLGKRRWIQDDSVERAPRLDERRQIFKDIRFPKLDIGKMVRGSIGPRSLEGVR